MNRRELIGLGTATGVSYAAGIVVTKLVAVRFGTDGVGYQGALMGLSALFASLALVGQLRYSQVWWADHEERGIGALFSVAYLGLLLTLPWFALAAALVALGAIQGLTSLWVLTTGVVLLVVGQALALLQPILMSTSLGAKVGARSATTAALASTLATSTLLWFTPLTALPVALGAGLVAGQALVLGWNFAQVQGFTRSSMTDQDPRSGSMTQKLGETIAYLRSGLPSYPGVVANALIWGGLPLVALAAFGAETSGLFRSAWSIATILPAVATAIQLNSYLPRLAKASGNPLKSSHLNFQALTRVVIPAACASAIISISAPALLHLLYSEQFVQASTSLGILSAAAVPRLLFSFNAMALMGHNRLRGYTVLEITSGVLLLLAVATSSLVGQLDALAVALFAATSLAFVASEFKVRADLGPGQSPTSALTGLTLATLLTSMLVSVGAAVAYA